MNIKEIFECFERLHSYSFATIGGDYPEIRIAHFLTYDDDGLYFQTMKVKPFYLQLIKTNKVAACALVANDGAVVHDELGLSHFPPGYYMRISGEVKELSNEELNEKAKNDDCFLPLVRDVERYPTMTTFILHKFKGELYDYDFGKEHRDHKLERVRFSFNGMNYLNAGFTIDKDKCISCGTCAKVCTFDAIVPGQPYSINGTRCDECGSCYSVCPVNAVETKVPMNEDYRKACGRKILDNIK